jgi:CxxC motif-containing protein (DUF1111 family)
MPRIRLYWAALRMPRRHFEPAPPGGRLFAFALIALGVGFIALASVPMLVPGQAQASQTQAQSSLSVARDPGVRGGAPAAGGPITGLSQHQLEYFQDGLVRFNEVDNVASGLGPRFNMDSCGGCHAQPAAGGSSPATNPQIAVAHNLGATNQIPSFITSNGPVREARFVTNADGSPDGGVHDLFTIAGRSDAPAGCDSSQIKQPNFAAAQAANNVIFRIPTPTFGAGLIAAIPDYAIVQNRDADGFRKSNLGIIGVENREHNTGTITRYGWKAQNKSLAIFSGEAYLVEQGVANEVFTQKRGEEGDRGTGIADRVEPAPVCLAGKDDGTNFDATMTTDVSSDVVGFTIFMELTAPALPAPPTPSTENGRLLFNGVGCALCHTPSLKTGNSRIAALSNQNVNLYSDLLLHHMGDRLADRVTQGDATGDMFRSAPLWGLGQRIFLLHDGRTKDLVEAIFFHASSGSEANTVVRRFFGLTATQQQDVLNFLRSL